MFDLVIVNARIWTGVPGAPDAQAIAIAGGRIAALGRTDEIRKLAQPGGRVIDAGGRRVVPGFHDTHLHTIASGQLGAQLDLRHATDRTVFVEAIARRARELPAGAWLLGGNWNVESWPDASPPRREWIDSVSGDRPVYLLRTDCHQALANSAALQHAGIDSGGPPDPAGGEIERDSRTGHPTGILKDAAMPLVAACIPAATEDELLDALIAAMRELNRFGVTSIHDITELEHLNVLARAHREGRLTVRLTGYLNVSDWDAHHDTIHRFPANDDRLRIAGFKGFMDGSLGSRTAFMREPYSDAGAGTKHPRGLLMEMVQPPQRFRTMMRRARDAGFQIAVHAIGDEANHVLLDHYAAIGAPSVRGVGPHRIEHAQHLLPGDIARFAELGVVAVMQPLHKLDDGRFAEHAIGPERSRTTYAWRSVQAAGATVSFGSDWPVAVPDVMAGIAAAVTGRTADGRTWVPEQNITVEQALRAYTHAAAVTVDNESRCGTLEPGKLADLAILSQDILSIPPERIAATTVTHTILGGRVVWEADVEKP